MESLQIIKFSIRKGRTLNFTEGTSWQDELREFELIARTESTGDPETYERTIDIDEDSDTLDSDLEQLQRVLVSAMEGDDSNDDEDEEAEAAQDPWEDEGEEDWYADD
jgi:hypothetical protein